MKYFWIGFVRGMAKMGAVMVKFPRGLSAIRREWREIDTWWEPGQ